MDEKRKGKAWIDFHGEIGRNDPTVDANWGYIYYVGDFNIGAAKVRSVDDHYELFEEFTINHSRGQFPERRIKIMGTDSPKETDRILQETAEESVRHLIAQDMGIEYIGILQKSK